jgi:hypothetical protein
MIKTILFDLLKTIIILGIFHFTIPPIIYAKTRNRWIKLPIMLVFAVIAGIFMAWLNYVPYFLFFLWIVINKYTLRAMTGEKFESEAGMKINKPLYYISSYSYVFIACFSAWFFQCVEVDSTGKEILLWKHLLSQLSNWV